MPVATGSESAASVTGEAAARERGAAFAAYGATEGEVAELLAYSDASPSQLPADLPLLVPLPDEPFVGAWDSYAADARQRGVHRALRARLVQLGFPVAPGMSASAPYQAATRRGIASPFAEADALELAEPDGLELRVHETAAGRVPVIVARAREDFVALVRALAHRNEPHPIPDSMGACIVGGYNNWDRVAALRAAWQAHASDRDDEHAWAAAFREIVPHRELYQDRFIILGTGPYSGMPARSLGLGDEDWLARSATIRLEHECAHYFTRRVLGSMRNDLLDELVADFVGIVASEGRYRAPWARGFLGLEAFPQYRVGGRLENYRRTPTLSDGAFRVLQHLVVDAIAQLARYDARRTRDPDPLVDRARSIMTIMSIRLAQLAAPDAADVLLAHDGERSVTGRSRQPAC
jgi:hypothetical protein